MKKAGSSSSKSKTDRNSKSTATKRKKTEKSSEAVFSTDSLTAGASGAEAALLQALAVGHQPAAQLTPQDETLFRAFQSNLMSLISHELRTPLMGILNALGLLEEGAESGELPAAELVRMARQNAQRLHKTLAALLDVAALESGTFHARLREVDLHRLVSGRVDAHRSQLRDRRMEIVEQADTSASIPILADPQKVGRGIDLCFQALIPRTAEGSRLEIRISSARVELVFSLAPGMEGLWDSAWMQALAGAEGGVSSPGSAFAGVMQSEQAFLTRMEEGLGSEFLLIHQIMRIHRGELAAVRSGHDVTLELRFPALASVEGLKAVLASRAYAISTELGSVALVLIEVPKGLEPTEFTAEIRKSLFRSSDAVYALPDRGQAALVLDDCKPEDAPRLMERIARTLAAGTSSKIRYGAAQCPSDGLDPALLLPLAESRLKSSGA